MTNPPSILVGPSCPPTTAAPSARASDPRVRAVADSPRWFRSLGLVALAAYAVFLAAQLKIVAGGSDSSGYLNSARLLAEGRLQTELRVPPELGGVTEVNRYHFSPQGFGQFAGNPHLPPSYPTGLPLHLAAAGRLFGWEAGPLLVLLAGAVGAVWLCYRAARELGVHYLLAAAGAAMLAGFPVFIFTSIQTLSDTLATTWALAALWCGLRARTSRGWAAACGAALAMAVLVRPTNLLLAPALLVLIGWDVRRLAAFIAGGLPGAIWFLSYNHFLYGGALRSGYGTIHAAFSLTWGWPTAGHFLKWLALLLPAVVLLLPLAAFFGDAKRRRELAALLLAGGAIVGVYLFYDVSHDVWWCLRFILPAVAALILAAVLGAETLAQRLEARGWRALRVGMACGLMGWTAGLSWHWTRSLHVLYVPGYEQAYADAAKLVRERVPTNALVVCSAFSGALYYYTGLAALVYDSVKPEEFAGYRARTQAAGRPIFAAVFDIEEEDALRTRCPGAWQRIAAAGNIGIWELK